MQKYFVILLQGYPLKLFSKNIEMFQSIFSNQSFFFLQNHPFYGLLVSKTYTFIHVKKKHKISPPSAGGGGSRP